MIANRLQCPDQRLADPTAAAPVPMPLSHQGGGIVSVGGWAGDRGFELLVVGPGGGVLEDSVSTYTADGYTTTTVDPGGLPDTLPAVQEGADVGVRLAAAVAATLCLAANAALAVVLFVVAINLLRRTATAERWAARYAVAKLVAVGAGTAALMWMMYASTASHARAAGSALGFNMIALLAAVASVYPIVLLALCRRRRRPAGHPPVSLPT